jgi:hypothetical protein
MKKCLYIIFFSISLFVVNCFAQQVNHLTARDQETAKITSGYRDTFRCQKIDNRINILSESVEKVKNISLNVSLPEPDSTGNLKRHELLDKTDYAIALHHQIDRYERKRVTGFILLGVGIAAGASAALLFISASNNPQDNAGVVLGGIFLGCAGLGLMIPGIGISVNSSVKVSKFERQLNHMSFYFRYDKPLSGVALRYTF